MRRDSTASGLCLVAFATAAMLAFSTAAAAQVSAPQRVQITDSGRLQAMGFAPNAVVYELVGADDPTAPVPTEGGGLSAPNYFGSASGFTTAMARAFQGRESVFGYNSAGGVDDIYNFNPASENFADAQIDIPNGAVIEFVRMWWDDTSVQNFAFFLLESCQPLLGGGDPVNTTLASFNSSGSAGAGSSVFTLPAATIATSDRCTYRIRARFGDGALSGPGNSTLTLNKGRVQWRRQASPAPGIATFNDVPTGHPFFRFVEALVTSGITGGCGGGNYCPDTAVTRGQMAVFLASALGLNWGF